MEDYYLVLGIGRGANLEKIKKAYRTIVKKYHPDVSRNQEAGKRFLEIRNAYETLSDESKRRQYDADLENERSSLRIRKVPEIIKERVSQADNMERIFSSTVDDFLEGFLPGFFDAGKGRIAGKDLYYEALLSLKEAANGGLYTIRVPVLEACQRCNKSGLFDSFFCPVCNGYGRVHAERGFSLSIPPNVKHGTEVRLPLDDIGLKDVYLNVTVYIDPELDYFY